MKQHPIQFFKNNDIDKEWRQQQIDVINAVHDNWSKYKYFALNLPVGVGKSFIATSIADSVKNAYIVTTTLQLQDQYMSSWDKLVNLKGRSNYVCSLNTNFTVDAAPCAANPDLYNMCKKEKRCPYINQKVKALASQAMITNPVYMLYSTHCGFAKDEDSPWTERDVFIMDECVRGDAKILIDVDHEVNMHEIFHNHNITHVTSFNEITNKYEQKRITRRIRMEYDINTIWYSIQLSFGDIKTSLIVTGNHKIWTSNRGYTRADELTNNDILKFDIADKKDISRKFISQRAIKTYVKNANLEKNIICPTCDRSFNNFGFKQHQKTVKEIRTCLNEKCSNTFEVMITNHNQKYCCHKCYSSSALIALSRSHHMTINNPMNDPACVKKMGDSVKHNWRFVRSEEDKKIQLTRFKNAPLHSRNRNKPNKLEQLIIDLNIPEIKFTGLGDKWVTFKNGKHKNPDFYVKGTNKVIEIGDIYFWHTLEEIEKVKLAYKEIGYECLYLTNHSDDLAMLKESVHKFVFNHDLKIDKIRKIAKPRSFNKNKDHFKYNIEVEDNHNYFANSILISNCHNAEDSLVSFAESDVDPQKYHDDFGVATNGIIFTGRSEEDYFKVQEIREILMEKAVELADKLESEFPKANLFGMDLKEWAKGFNDKTSEKVRKLNAKIYQLDKAIQPINIFFNTHDTPEELVTRWIVSKHSDRNVLKLSPIYGDFLFHGYFGKLAKKFVFLSATLGTKTEFCKELGIKEEECFFMETGSPFKPEKSPIIIMPSIKLSKDVYDKNVKKLGGLIDEILKMHKGRGVIHSVTYDIAKHIYNGVSPENRKRLLCRDMDILSNVNLGKNQYPKKYKNSELLEIHETQGGGFGSVLLSPSMMEGIDLHDDLSEFQVITKLPWGNLGDIRIKTKSQLDPNWYAGKMWLNILQASGRSTRHEEDESTTYILDEKFNWFLKQWQHKLPKWFTDRLVF